MTFDKILFATVAALGALLLVVVSIEQPENATGVEHPRFHASGMEQGGDASRHDSILPVAWMLGAVLVTLMSSIIGFGAGQRGRRNGFLKPLCCGWLLHLSAFSLMVLIYQRTAGDPAVPLFWSLPPSTAVMMYVLWPCPLVFLFTWVWGFPRFVFNEEDHAAYQALLAAKAANGSAAIRDNGLEETP